MKTFKCDFGNGTTCEVDVTDDPPPKDKPQAHIVAVRWDTPDGGKPKINFRAYIGWMNSVNTQLANEWNIKLMHVYATKPNWAAAEIWVFEPWKPPKLTDKI